MSLDHQIILCGLNVVSLYPKTNIMFAIEYEPFISNALLEMSFIGGERVV